MSDITTKTKCECTLTDEELIEKCHHWISEMCAGREKWTMFIPARPNDDPDLMLSEALRRFSAARVEVETLKESINSKYWERIASDNTKLKESRKRIMGWLKVCKEKLLDSELDADTLRVRVKELEAQVLAMRCCGNCKYSFVRGKRMCRECADGLKWQPRTESDKGKAESEEKR